mmetsp:Transcript_67755/g.167387  ORF Transcript_67755/g.167387 Transcript_67755/m.167387 type:complete len:286 (+) Transcript_67755:411-1268(+)
MRPKMAFSMMSPPRACSVWRLRATANCMSSMSVLASARALEICSAFVSRSRWSLRRRRAMARGRSQRALMREPRTAGKMVPAVMLCIVSSRERMMGTEKSCPMRSRPSLSTTPRIVLSTHEQLKPLFSEILRLHPMTRSSPRSPIMALSDIIVRFESRFCALIPSEYTPKPAQKVPVMRLLGPAREPRSLTPVWGPPTMYWILPSIELVRLRETEHRSSVYASLKRSAILPCELLERERSATRERGRGMTPMPISMMALSDERVENRRSRASETAQLPSPLSVFM